MVHDRRRIAAIVSADVAGYSRLMKLDERGTLADLNLGRESAMGRSRVSHDSRNVGR